MTQSRNKKSPDVRRLVLDGLLTAAALAISLIESQFPPLVPIPGVKAGLANIVTVYAMFVLGPGDAFSILICRIFLGSFFSGRIISLAYSLTGGMFCFLITLVLRKILTARQIWVSGVIGAVFHNIGQVLAAIVIFGTPAVAVYLPFLTVSGIITGFFTGLTAQMIVNRLPSGFLPE